MSKSGQVRKKAQAAKNTKKEGICFNRCNCWKKTKACSEIGEGRGMEWSKD